MISVFLCTFFVATCFVCVFVCVRLWFVVLRFGVCVLCVVCLFVVPLSFLLLLVVFCFG